MIRRYASGGPWERTYGYSRAVRTGDRVVTAGCTATAATLVLVAGLLDPEMLVEVEVEAVVDAPGPGPVDRVPA